MAIWYRHFMAIWQFCSNYLGMFPPVLVYIVKKNLATLVHMKDLIKTCILKLDLGGGGGGKQD
jgi:hypothetical protein